MKNIVILAGLMASFFVLTACSNCGTSSCAQPEPAPCHQDLKGEVGK